MIGSGGGSLARVGEQMKRALILESSPSSARLLADLLRNLSACESWTAQSNARALELATNPVERRFLQNRLRQASPA